MDIATGLVGLIGLVLVIAGAAGIVVHRRRMRSQPAPRLAARVSRLGRIPGD